MMGWSDGKTYQLLTKLVPAGDGLNCFCMLRRTSDNRFGQPNVYGGYLVKHRLASQQDLDDFCANRYCLGAGQGTPYCVASCKEQSFAQLGLDTEKAYNWPCEYMCQQRIYGDTEDMNIMIRSIDNPDPLVHF